VELTGPDPFGAVQGGSITVSCQWYSINLRERAHERFLCPVNAFTLFIPHSRTALQECSVDMDGALIFTEIHHERLKGQKNIPWQDRMLSSCFDCHLDSCSSREVWRRGSTCTAFTLLRLLDESFIIVQEVTDDGGVYRRIGQAEVKGECLELISKSKTFTII